MSATSKASINWDEAIMEAAARIRKLVRCRDCNGAGTWGGLFGAPIISCPTCDGIGWVAPAPCGAAPSDGPSGLDEKNQ